jgi:hypothetical protein
LGIDVYKIKWKPVSDCVGYHASWRIFCSCTFRLGRRPQTGSILIGETETRQQTWWLSISSICSSFFQFVQVHIHFLQTPISFFLDLDFLPLLWRAFAISTSYFRSVSFEGIDRSIVLRVDRIFLFSLGHPRSRGDETLADSSCTNAAVRPEWICTCFFYW